MTGQEKSLRYGRLFSLNDQRVSDIIKQTITSGKYHRKKGLPPSFSNSCFRAQNPFVWILRSAPLSKLYSIWIWRSFLPSWHMNNAQFYSLFRVINR